MTPIVLDKIRLQTSTLSIWSLEEQIREGLTKSSNMVISCAPGSGKSTILPLLLAVAAPNGGKIALLEPRRIAAWSIAARMAELLNEEVGATVGLRMRFENKVSPLSKIEVMTEGTLIRILQSDSELREYGAVILDEFHERSLTADLALALLREVQQALRPDLKIIVTSATLNERPLLEFLAPAINVTGSESRTYPVNIKYSEDRWQDSPGTIAATGVLRAVGETDGDILVFLPGQRDIRDCQEQLAQSSAMAQFAVFPFHGGLSLAEQRLAMTPIPEMRRVILSTSLAETSLTIEGISAVVDAGFTRVARWDPATGFSHYVTARVSKDAATQRSGRAGRLGPGVCFRLWSQRTHESLAASRQPEIAHGDLTGLVLEVLQWGAGGVAEIKWLDAPPEPHIKAATDVLRGLGIIDGDGRLTERGRKIATFPGHPRIAAMLVLALERGVPALGCALAAVLESGAGGREDLAADIFSLLHSSGASGKREGRGQEGRETNPSLASFRGWCSRLGVGSRAIKDTERGIGVEHGELGSLVAAAYPERVARRRSGEKLGGGNRRYLLAQGSGARLREGTQLEGREWLAIADIHISKEDSIIVRAVPYEAAELEGQFSDRISEAKVLRIDPERGRVLTRRERRFGAIVLHEKPVRTELGPEEEELLLTFVQDHLQGEGGSSGLPIDIESLKLFCQQLRFAAHWMPEEGWPPGTLAALAEQADTWLIPLLHHYEALCDIPGAELLETLERLLSSQQYRTLRQEVPRSIRLSNRQRTYPIDYTQVARPFFAARLQDLLGVIKLPRLAKGRAPLTVALLSPAGRPLQVTADLAGFWASSYNAVRKEMRGRYPKHNWPEDPISGVKAIKVEVGG